MASRPLSFALILALGHGGGTAAIPSSSPNRNLRATASRAAGGVDPGPIVPQTLRSEASTISPKCLGALADAADEDGELDREGYFAVVNAVSNGYYSFNGMTSYGDLPFPVKYGFAALSCRCLSLGGDDGCCTGDRAWIDIEGISRGLGGMPEDLVAYVADICGVIRGTVGENILPEAPSSSPSPSATPAGSPTAGPKSRPSGTPTGSPKSLRPRTVPAGLSATPTTIPASPPTAAVEPATNPQTVGKAARGNTITVSQKCLNALSASAENGKLGKDNYFVFTDAMSNSYYSFNGMNEYSDLPFRNKFSFVTLSCRCHAMGGREECCQGDRARIVIEGIDAEDPGSMSGELAEYVADICGVTEDSIGDNIRPPTGELRLTAAPAGSARLSGSPSSRPSMTPTRSPTAGPTTRPSVTPTRSPTAVPTANPTTPLPTTAKPTTNSPDNATNPPTTNPPTTNPPTTNPPATNPPATNPTNPPTTESPTNVLPATDRPTDEVSLVHNINLREPTPSPTDEGVPTAIVPPVPDFDGDRKGRGDGDNGLPAGAWAGIAITVGCIVALGVNLLAKRERREEPRQDEGLGATPGVKALSPSATGGATSGGQLSPDGTNVMTASEASSVRSVATSEHDAQDTGALSPPDDVFLPRRPQGQGVLRSSSGEVPGLYDDDGNGSLDQAIESGNWEAVAASVVAAVVKQNEDPPSPRTTQDVDTAVEACNMAEL